MEYEYQNYFGTIFSPISPIQTVPACPVQIRAHHHIAVYRQQPVLISPQVNKDYVIHCDASMYSYSGILQQTRPEMDELAPVAYFSGNFDKTQV